MPSHKPGDDVGLNQIMCNLDIVLYIQRIILVCLNTGLVFIVPAITAVSYNNMF